MSTPDPRRAAAEQAMMMPEFIQVGPYKVRKCASGDMILASQLGLKLASGDMAKIAEMTREEQTFELLQIGALMCHSIEALKLALWKSGDHLRAEFISPVLFGLSPHDTAELISIVGVYFGQGAAVAFEVEEKPRTDTDVPEPKGNG